MEPLQQSTIGEIYNIWIVNATSVNNNYARLRICIVGSLAVTIFQLSRILHEVYYHSYSKCLCDVHVSKSSMLHSAAILAPRSSCRPVKVKQQELLQATVPPAPSPLSPLTLVTGW